MKDCPICRHEQIDCINSDLQQIENRQSEQSLGSLIKAIADKYDVRYKDLLDHLMSCQYGLDSPATSTDFQDLGVAIEQSKQEDSLASKIKVSDAKIIVQLTEEYMSTLNLVGKRIRRYAANDENDMFERAVSKAVTDLYLGLGINVRDNIKTLSDLNKDLNGPQTSAGSGLMALAQAIEASK